MSDLREKGGFERLGEAFAHDLRIQGEEMLDESAQRLRGPNLTDSDFAAAQQGFTEGPQRIRLSQNVVRLFINFVCSYGMKPDYVFFDKLKNNSVLIIYRK